MKKMPRYNKFRPDFMAPGPYIAVQKAKPLSFDARPQSNDANDDDFQPYRYYESDKILGKLYRAIDEREVFHSIQQRGLSHVHEVDRTRGLVSSVLDDVWTYLQRRCQAIQWEHHLERARGIRDEYVLLILSHPVKQHSFHLPLRHMYHLPKRLTANIQYPDTKTAF